MAKIAVKKIIYTFLAASSLSDKDPGSKIQCLFYSWSWDPGWVKNKDPDPG
jgi:hypothetical protein